MVVETSAKLASSAAQSLPKRSSSDDVSTINGGRPDPRRGIALRPEDIDNRLDQWLRLAGVAWWSDYHADRIGLVHIRGPVTDYAQRSGDATLHPRRARGTCRGRKGIIAS